VIPVYSLLLVCFYQYKVHTGLRVQRAPGVPHALYGAAELNNASGASRCEGVNACLELEVMFGIGGDSVIPGRCEASNPESRDSGVWSCGPSRNDSVWIASRSLSSGAHSRDPLAKQGRLYNESSVAV
jgi:hypothetical protein